MGFNKWQILDAIEKCDFDLYEMRHSHKFMRNIHFFKFRCYLNQLKTYGTEVKPYFDIFIPLPDND